MWLGAPRELKVDVHLWFVVQGSTAQPMKVGNQEILWSHPASNQLVFVFLQKEDTRDLLGRSLKLKQLNKVKDVKMPLMRLTFRSFRPKSLNSCLFLSQWDRRFFWVWRSCRMHSNCRTAPHHTGRQALQLHLHFTVYKAVSCKLHYHTATL